jgi:hypothetical protein
MAILNINELSQALQQQFSDLREEVADKFCSSFKTYTVRVLSRNQLVAQSNEICLEILKGNGLDFISKITSDSPEAVKRVTVVLKREPKEVTAQTENQRIFDLFEKMYIDSVQVDIEPYDIFEFHFNSIILQFCNQTLPKSLLDSREKFQFDHFIWNGEKIR